MQLFKKYTLIYLIIITIISKINSQELYHDPKLSWYTIKTEHFSIHTTADHINLGIRIGNICENIYPIVSHSLDFYPKRTQVVIHTENDDFNGFSTAFPWRMELFVTPPQGSISGKNIYWLESLIIHEFTHITHLRKHKGIISLAKPIFGDYSSLWQMITPVWFTEGIATFNETRFGTGGRGRNPHFWMQMAEPIVNNNYWKLDNSNYYSRNKLPTSLMPYISGYYVTDRVNQKFGDYSWGRILNRYSAYPIFGFKNAIQSVTGESVHSLYEELISDFKVQIKSNKIHPNLKIWSNSNNLDGQYSPRWIDNNNIAFYQKGIKKTQKLVKVDRNGEIQVLLNRKISNIDNCFAVRDSLIYTSEPYNAIKYSATKYSDLHKYNLNTNQRERLTNQKHLYSIDVAYDQKKLIAVETNLPNNRLTIIDSKTGNIIKYINFENYVVLNPRWSPSGNKIAISLQDSAGMANIAVYDIKTNKWGFVYQPNLNQDNYPCWSQDEKTVFYSSDQSGIFNIWAADITTGERWMITDVEFGAFTPDISPTGNEVAFSQYTKHGFRIVTQKLNVNNWVSSNKIKKENKLLYSQVKTTFDEIKKVEKQQYSISKYSALSQIFKPQGWIPYLYDEENGKGIAAYVRAEDALHRHQWYGKLGVSLNQITPTFDMNYLYSKYWPKLNVKVYSLPRKIDKDGWWRETGFEYGLSAPLILENNIYRTMSVLSMQFKQNQLKTSKGTLNPDKRIYRGFSFEFLLNRSSYTFKNITPYLASFFKTKIEISNSFLMSDYNSKRYSSELDLFLPILNGSNLELYFGYLFRNGDYEYSNNFVPIGYSTNSDNNQFRLVTSIYLPLVFLEWQTPIIPIFVEYLYLKPFIDNNISWNGNINQIDSEINNSVGFQLSSKNILFHRYNFEFGINIYKKSISNHINYTPFIQFNI